MALICSALLCLALLKRLFSVPSVLDLSPSFLSAVLSALFFAFVVLLAVGCAMALESPVRRVLVPCAWDNQMCCAVYEIVV